MLAQLFRCKEHGCLDAMRIVETLLISSGLVTQLIAVQQHHAGLFLLFLHPAEVLSVVPDPVSEQYGVQQER